MADDGLDELDALLASLDDGPKEPEVVIDDPDLVALFEDGFAERAADEVAMTLYKSFVSLKREFKHVHAPSASEGLKVQAIEEFVKCLDSLVTSVEVDRAVSFTGPTGIEKDLMDLNATFVLRAITKRLESREDIAVISTYLREEVDPTELSRQLEVVTAFARPDAMTFDVSKSKDQVLKAIKNARLNFKYTAMEESPDWLQSHSMDEFLESMDEIVLIVEAQRLQHVEGGGGVLKDLGGVVDCPVLKQILEDRLAHQSDDLAVIGRIKKFDKDVIEEEMKKYCVFLGGEE